MYASVSSVCAGFRQRTQVYSGSEHDPGYGPLVGQSDFAIWSVPIKVASKCILLYAYG